jgi:hypothetical protein
MSAMFLVDVCSRKTFRGMGSFWSTCLQFFNFKTFFVPTNNFRRFEIKIGFALVNNGINNYVDVSNITMGSTCSTYCTSKYLLSLLVQIFPALSIHGSIV